MMYRGWEIRCESNRSQEVWIARQAGVQMNTNTEEGIKKMVDDKIWIRKQAEARTGGPDFRNH